MFRIASPMPPCTLAMSRDGRPPLTTKLLRERPLLLNKARQSETKIEGERRRRFFSILITALYSPFEF